MLLGPPGVGKTHLAVGPGLKAIECRYRVLFTTAAGMIGTLTKALAEGRLEEKLRLHAVPRLVAPALGGAAAARVRAHERRSAG